MPEVKQSYIRLYNICFSLCFTVMLLGLIELGAFFALRIWDPANRDRLAHDDQPVYQRESWGRKYWEEESESARFTYQSYVGWRQLPYSGQTITVDSELHRKTVNSQCDGSTHTIWMFGGSTMWGTGSPDWETIPSDLANIFVKAGEPVCVWNFGQTGWRNTQELIELELELKRNPRRPDLVIFYDGFNDGYSFYQSGKVDVHMNFDSIREQFEKSSSRRTLTSSFVDLLLSTHTARLIAGAHRTHSWMDGDAIRAHISDAEARKDLEVSYLDNLKVVQALSGKYGFQYAFFWQPLIVAGHKHLTNDEEKIISFYHGRIEEDDIEYRAMSAYLKQSSPPHLFDIADVFDAVSDTVYIDCVHVAPEGNELIAERMYAGLHELGWTK